MKLGVGSVGARGHIHPMMIIVVGPGKPAACYSTEHGVVTVTIEARSIKN